MVYFERYFEANDAYDKARELGLPQRMFRYQFGPFIANFQWNRTEDLLALTDYALQRTEMSEETWLWHGWALYRNGDTNGAVENWRKALSVHPGYEQIITITPTEAGEFGIACNEYCGIGHHQMTGRIRVVE